MVVMVSKQKWFYQFENLERQPLYPTEFEALRAKGSWVSRGGVHWLPRTTLWVAKTLDQEVKG